MSRIFDALQMHAKSTPLHIALQDENRLLTYGELPAQITRLADQLREISRHAIAILADNGVDWALTDLAAHSAEVSIIPLPLFFSPSQIAHVLKITGINHVLTDQPEHFTNRSEEPGFVVTPFFGTLSCVEFPASTATTPVLPAKTRKVTFTSGTTGEPKGVCLTADTMEKVAVSLQGASAATQNDRHLCLLPLATLLENIGGIYVPLLAGATICVPRLAQVGLSGSSGLDVRRLLRALNDWQASTAIMVPQILQAVVEAGQVGIAMPRTLRYLAVGGAPVSSSLRENADALGLPVFEGYGLSECGSVVAVNRPGEARNGSVGKPLPHVQISFADDGEILIRGIEWEGYLGDSQTKTHIATGDIGHLDDDGFLYLTGRKKNVFITSFGRNVAPEWVEGELVSQNGIAQAAVFGEAQPYNSAVIVAYPDVTRDAIQSALDRANKKLPDYAKVRAWIAAIEPFTSSNGMTTPNGRLRRTQILGRYAAQLSALYQQ